ncbi:MAG: hypothetical protein HKO59_12625 [Phycisphaerales bacterium]|nr:hypothetical protein [Phycisphaerae bacterium]NNF45013.1 hypothetical protein [Phycisphaerales bacterium]NNM26807.1 hypothetical protein [Phycisphaerales bacterium]
MMKAVIQNGVLFGGMAVGAVVTSVLTPGLETPTGEIGASVLHAESIVRAVVAMAGATLVAAAVGVAVGKVCNTAVGLFAAGGAWFGLAWRAGTIESHLFDGVPLLFAVETLGLGVVVGVVAWLVFRLAGPLTDVGTDDEGRTADPYRSVAAGKMIAAGILVLPVVWLFAQSTLKGQTLGAVFCGSMVAGLVGRLVAPNTQPIVLFAAPMLFLAIAQAVAGIAMGGPLSEVFVTGSVPAFLRVMPVDAAVGALTGVGVGLGWARSFLHEDEASPAAALAGGRHDDA